MGGKPQARLTDANVHPPVVISGSPDVTVCFLPAARLNDLTAPCPLCGPPTPPGKIVTSSSTVFINGLGAARVTDKVACGAGGGPPGGCSHPPAQGYSVRPDDGYQKMMKGEHEASEFDQVREIPAQEQDGARDDAQVAAGIKPSGGRSAARAPGETKADPTSSQAKPYASGAHPSPWGRQAGRGDRRNASELEGGDARADLERNLTGRHSLGLGEKSVGAKFGEIDPETKNKPWYKRLFSSEKDDDEGRTKITINLGISIELSFGSRSAQAGYGGAPNMIAKGCTSVIVG